MKNYCLDESSHIRQHIQCATIALMPSSSMKCWQFCSKIRKTEEQVIKICRTRNYYKYQDNIVLSFEIYDDQQYVSCFQIMFRGSDIKGGHNLFSIADQEFESCFCYLLMKRICFQGPIIVRILRYQDYVPQDFQMKKYC